MLLMHLRVSDVEKKKIWKYAALGNNGRWDYSNCTCAVLQSLVMRKHFTVIFLSCARQEISSLFRWTVTGKSMLDSSGVPYLRFIIQSALRLIPERSMLFKCFPWIVMVMWTYFERLRAKTLAFSFSVLELMSTYRQRRTVFLRKMLLRLTISLNTLIWYE